MLSGSGCRVSDCTKHLCRLLQLHVLQHSFVGAPNRRSVSSISCAPNFMPDSPPVVPAGRLVSSISTESWSQNSPRRTPSILSTNSFTQLTPTSNGHEYVNTDVKEQPWYMGDGDRIDAQNKLTGLPDGAFLVRYSIAQDRYAVSIRFVHRLFIFLSITILSSFLAMTKK
jgi:hypothetical protein